MNSFDQLTKGLANGGLSRRDGLKLAFGGAAFAALSALGIGSAAAASPSYESLCKGITGTCSSGFTQCGPNPHCFCGEHINRGGETFCACNFFCSGATSCTSNSQCPTAQTLCSDNNQCTSCSPGIGVCVHKCKGQFKNCAVVASANAAGARTFAFS